MFRSYFVSRNKKLNLFHMLRSQDFKKKISNITSTNRALVFMGWSDFRQLDENHIIHKKYRQLQ